MKPTVAPASPAVDADPRDEALFHWPIVTEEDEAAVLGVLRSGTMSGNDISKKFEAEFGRWQNRVFALTHPNGTAALLAAFWACGVGAGDEIICPSMTYWASAQGALQLGATVNFADVEPDSLCLDPDDIEHRIGPRTKAIVVVHYCGHPCDMDRILPIARKHNLKVIEDNSHAVGSQYKGRKCGALGDVAAMSMMAGKGFAIGEGGMLVTDDRSIYERAVAFGVYERTGGASRYAHGADITDPELLRFRGQPIGAFKHRINQTASAMGRAQLKHFDARVEQMQLANRRFWSLLDDVAGLSPHHASWLTADCSLGTHYFARGFFDADAFGGTVRDFCAIVAEEGWAACTPGSNAPLHLHPVFHEADIFRQGRPTAVAFGQRDVRQGAGALPVSEAVADRTFAVPWFKHDWPDRIEKYAEAFRRAAERLRA